MRFCGRRSRFSTGMAPPSVFTSRGVMTRPHHDPVRRWDCGSAVADRPEQRAGRVPQGHRSWRTRQSRAIEPPDEPTARVKGRRESGGCAGGRRSGSRGTMRTNAPLTVLTLDRAARCRCGITKTSPGRFPASPKPEAVWVWDGRKRSIFLTVAGPAGELLEEDGSVITKLKANHCARTETPSWRSR